MDSDSDDGMLNPSDFALAVPAAAPLAAPAAPTFQKRSAALALHMRSAKRLKKLERDKAAANSALANLKDSRSYIYTEVMLGLLEHLLQF